MQAYSKFCDQLKAQHRFRRLPLKINSKNKLDFTHNDYLGLSKHPKVIQAAIDSIYEDGVGARASRVLSGTVSIHCKLEARISQIKNKSGALLFSSGFVANQSTIAALVNKNNLKSEVYIFSDKYIHASLHAGCFTAGVKQQRFLHNDYDHLEALLKKNNQIRSKNSINYILVESVYSMDGDCCDLKELAYLSEKYHANLYIDESHAIGVLGENGYGLTENIALPNDSIIMGTLSKALGAQGGFIAADAAMIDYLINSASGFIYSTGLSPILAKAALTSIDLLSGDDMTYKRDKILSLGRKLNLGFKKLGYETYNTATHIVPLILKQDHLAIKMHESLKDHGVNASLIRPPTVPNNTARLRFAINVDHNEEDIEFVLKILKEQ